MAAAIWIVRKLTSDKQLIIDGIETVFVNQDDADTEATVLSDLHTAIIAAGHDIPAAGYFNTADLALSATNLDTDEDMVLCGKREEVLA